MEQICLGQVHSYTLKMLLVSQHISMFLLKHHDTNFLLAPCSHYPEPVTSAEFLPESVVRRMTKLILPNLYLRFIQNNTCLTFIHTTPNWAIHYKIFPKQRFTDKQLPNDSLTGTKCSLNIFFFTAYVFDPCQSKL